MTNIQFSKRNRAFFTYKRNRMNGGYHEEAPRRMRGDHRYGRLSEGFVQLVKAAKGIFAHLSFPLNYLDALHRLLQKSVNTIEFQ